MVSDIALLGSCSGGLTTMSKKLMLCGANKIKDEILLQNSIINIESLIGIIISV